MANVNIRIDETLKRDTEYILSELGLTLTAATTMFYKQVVRYAGIPFELIIDCPNNETRKALSDSQKIISDGTSRNFSSIAEMRMAMDIENTEEVI